MSIKKSKPKKTTKEKSAKVIKNKKLAAGAAEIRKAEKEAKKKRVVDNTPEVLPPIEPSAQDIGDILANRVKRSEDNASLVLSKDTSAGEYIAIFDNLTSMGERVQFLIGDLINQGAELKCFGGKYIAAMASTGRSIDSLKAYASAAKNIPPALRAKHPAIGYTHLREIVKVPQLEDKKAIVADAVKAANKGEPMTVKQFRKEADKFKARKPKKKTAKVKKKDKKPPIAMSVAEREHFDEMLDAATRLETLIGTGNYALEISTADSLPLREKLDAIARFAAQLRE